MKNTIYIYWRCIYRYMNGIHIVTYHHGKLYGEINHFIDSGIYIHDNEELYIYIFPGGIHTLDIVC